MEEKKLTDEELDKLIKELEYQSWSQNLFELGQASYMLKYQKAEIERLTEENEYLDMVAKQALTDYQNTQVQVDELTDKLGKVLSGIKADELLTAKGIEQAVKDTAKEILQYVGDLYDDGDQRFRLKDYQWHKNLCKRYGVEVE